MLADPDALVARCADIFPLAVQQAIEERGRCSLALSRPTPENVFRAIGRTRIPRNVVDIYQVDERNAKTDSEDRNLKLIKSSLEGWVRDATLHPMPLGDDLGSSARKYAKLLEKNLGTPPVLDFVHLGLGPDGHTASLIPGDKVLDVDDKWVAATKGGEKYRRLTLTYPTINAARLVIFVVSGREKAEALRGVLQGDQSMPAARITNAHCRFYVDADAAALL